MREVAVDPAQNGADACDQLTRAERLREVVVGAQLEADELVGLIAPCGQHDDRHGRIAAERARHVEAIDAAAAQVQHDQVGGQRARRGKRLPVRRPP